VLADGTWFDGYLMGARAIPVTGELVFNTSMVGYQEVITDPSYAGQIVVMTYPQIGNYGVAPEDSEREEIAARALVVRELSPFFSPGPGRSSLEDFMSNRGLPGLTGIDTRAVTRHIRSRGVVTAAIGGEIHGYDELLALARSRPFSRGESLVQRVSGPAGRAGSGTFGRAAVVDLGMKKSILERVRTLGVAAQVFDAGFSAEAVLAGGFDFLVLSNGPGDPADVPQVVSEVRRLIGRIPILGICLGHQIVALALGGRTYKLKFGHRGSNQPVIERGTGRVFMTSQNHGYAVAEGITDTGVSLTYTNANDGTVEGFADDARMISCVQFHPEASPGPRDTLFVFRQFHNRIEGRRHAEVA
jgi:carbamoyl-phosphate synthase small subunit